MNAEALIHQKISRLKDRIAEIYAERERLKQALETGAIATRDGLQQLDETDRILSDLDTRFKDQWDAARQAGSAQPAATPRAAPAAADVDVHVQSREQCTP